MAQGIKLPLTAKNGRLQLLGGDDYIKQLVMTMLGDNDSDNPFEDLPVREIGIFTINDPLNEGEIREQIKKGFEVLETDQLAAFIDVTFVRVNEELKMLIEYEDLETGNRPTIEVPAP